MNPSPLRYPGGKYKLYNYVKSLIEVNGNTTYIEPFCGGSAISLELLFNHVVKKVGYISKMVNSRNRINEKIIFLHVSNTEEICDLMHSFLD